MSQTVEEAKRQPNSPFSVTRQLARLRVAAQLYAVAGFTLASPISAPVFAHGLPGRKKGNQISLVAFVKPGGRYETRTHDLCRVKAAL